VRGIRIRFSIPCSFNLLKKQKKIFEEDNCLTSPHPNPLPTWGEGLRAKSSHSPGLAETHG